MIIVESVIVHLTPLLGREVSGRIRLACRHIGEEFRSTPGHAGEATSGREAWACGSKPTVRLNARGGNGVAQNIGARRG